jgi:hypothetical protein
MDNWTNALTAAAALSSALFAGAIVYIEKNRDRRFNRVTIWCSPDYFVYGSLDSIRQFVNLNVYIDNKSGQPINDVFIRVFIRKNIEINHIKIRKSSKPIYEFSQLSLVPNIDLPPNKILVDHKRIDSAEIRQLLAQSESGEIKSKEFGKIGHVLGAELRFQDLTGKRWILKLNGRVRKLHRNKSR